MKLQVDQNKFGKVQAFNLELNKQDTYSWANRPHNRWPCSKISDRKLYVEFKKEGLLDLQIDGTHAVDFFLSSNELNSIIWDYLPLYLKQDFQNLFPNQTFKE